MNEQIRLRIDRRLSTDAAAVCKRLGITPTAAVSMFFSQMVRLGGLPFRPSEFPALDEYGVTLKQAGAAEDAAIAEMKAERKPGKTVVFSGKL